VLKYRKKCYWNREKCYESNCIVIVLKNFFTEKVVDGLGEKFLNKLLSGKIFRFVGHVLPLPPPPKKKHGAHGATEIIPPHISSWQSGIIKTAPYSANCACCLWSSLRTGSLWNLREPAGLANKNASVRCLERRTVHIGWNWVVGY
jgi:hypothetical protein